MKCLIEPICSNRYTFLNFFNLFMQVKFCLDVTSKRVYAAGMSRSCPDLVVMMGDGELRKDHSVDRIINAISMFVFFYV